MRKQTFYLVLLINLFINSQLFSANLIGYWHNWNFASSPYIQLNQIDPRYNIIEIAFAVPVSTTDMTMTFTPDAVSQAVLISQIESLQSLGKKVLISIGGATATIDLANITQRNNFVSSMTNIINTYGFDGIDIDIESGNSILINGGTIQNPANPSMQNLIEAIREIMQNYRAANAGKMMLTMAPETAYVQGGQSGFGSIWGGYLPIIHALRDSIDILQVQLYNSGTMYGIDGGIYSQGTADFIIAMTEAVIQGFNTNGGFFIGLPANKVAVGLPACSLAAGGGFVDSLSLRAAVNYLLGNAPQPGNYSLANPNGYPSLGGMMTWSINWDALASCGGAYSYANSFEVLFEDELSTPNLLSPANSAVNVSINPNLSWTAVNEAANYRIQISVSSDFNNNIINQLITQNNFAAANLNNNTQYFWRVRAENGANFGNWSNTFSFTTQAATFSLFGGIIYANSSLFCFLEVC